MSTPQPSRHEARRNETDEKITAAVFQVLGDRGFTGLSIEAVSEISGVAKTTIYRRYSDRIEMLSGIAANLNPAYGDYELTKEGLYHLLMDIFKSYQKYGGSRAIFGLMVGEASEIEELRSRLISTAVERIEKFFVDAKQAGSIINDADPRYVSNIILGSTIFTAVRKNQLETSLVDDIVEFVWPRISVENT